MKFQVNLAVCGWAYIFEHANVHGSRTSVSNWVQTSQQRAPIEVDFEMTFILCVLLLAGFRLAVRIGKIEP
jgi:hypothetical protein